MPSSTNAPTSRTVAFPLRIDDGGRLERGDACTSLMQLFKAMAGTPSRSWSHAPWFGLHESFLDANLALEDHPRLADLLNEALAELGIRWASVDSVKTPTTRAGSGEQRRFNITIALGEGDFYHGDLSA